MPVEQRGVGDNGEDREGGVVGAGDRNRSERARSAWGEPSKPTRMERNMVASLVVTENLAR